MTAPNPGGLYNAESEASEYTLKYTEYHFTRMVETRWGIKALQVHLHRDEGHYEIPGDDSTWKPNYHAHIIWDWMDHTTGKSIKLDADDMSAMQDMVAEALGFGRFLQQ